MRRVEYTQSGESSDGVCMVAIRGFGIITEKYAGYYWAEKESRNTAEKVVPRLRDMYAAARCWLTETSVRALYSGTLPF